LVSDTVANHSSVFPIDGKWISDQKTIQLSIADTLSGIKSYWLLKRQVDIIRI
jgi:hypothetical protein